MLNRLVVDIAHYTKAVDPLPLHEAGVQMMILKVDDHFVKNGKVFANAGMPVAAYHWIDPIRDANEQVDETLQTIRSCGFPVLAVFADFEQWWSRWEEWLRAIRGLLAWHLVGRFMGNRLSDHAKQVFERFRASEFPTLGYTRASFVNEFAPQASAWIPEYRWWLAHYREYGDQTLSWEDLRANILPTVNFFPDLPPGVPQDRVVGHQFTGDELLLPGLYDNWRRTSRAAADVNLFDEQFLAEISAVSNPPPLPAAQYEAVVTASPTLRVRSGPGTSFDHLYSLPKGAAVQLARLTDDWAKLRAYEEEWCSAHFLDVVTALSPTPDDHVEPDVDEGGEDEGAPPVIEPVVVDFEGVTYETERRFGTDCHILTIETTGKRFHVTPYTGLKTVSQAARNLDAQIVVNGDGWGINSRFPNSIAASDGLFYQRSQLHFRPWINISLTNNVTFAWRHPSNLYNAVSGDRYLIQHGRYNNAISNVTKDPRTAVGFAPGGKLILIVADGRTPQSAGLSFREMSDLFLEREVITAINLDGGGSSAMWIKDRIVNIPIDHGQPGRERSVANHFCVFIN
jgi:hypothetical protein